MRPLFVGLLLASLPWPVLAQTGEEPVSKRRYVHLPFDAKTLQNQMLLQKLLQLDLKGLPQTLPGLDQLGDPTDPEFAKKVEAIKSQLPQETKKQIDEIVDKFKKDNPKVFEDLKSAPPAGTTEPKQANGGSERGSERMMQWLRDVVGDLKDTDFADRLQKSRVFRDALKELDQWLESPEDSEWLGKGAEWLLDRLEKSEDLEWEWGQRQLERLQDWSHRSLENIRATRRQLPTPPSLPTAGTWQTVATVVLWLVLAGGILFGVARTVRLGRERRHRPAAETFPAPFVDDLAHLTTRSQLRDLFERWALHHLGAQARPWNHRHIARLVRQEAAPANELLEQSAQVYESARYRPGDEQLSPPERQALQTLLPRLGLSR